MEIWNDTFFSLDKPCSRVCEGLLGSGREHFFGARIFSQRTMEQVCFWEPGLLVFGPKGNLSLCSGHEELGGGPVFDLFLTALLCFAHLMF